MAMSYLLLTGIYTLMFLWILGFTYFFRHRISCMMGMMIAMTLGMTCGLGVGTIVGVAFPEQFFQASVISMIVGAVVGFIAGLFISLMAVLDGLLSGLMGGMMGAMFGVMISVEFLNSTVKIMAVLSAGILSILFITIQGEVKFKDNDWKNGFFKKPQPFFLLVCLFLLIVHQVQIPSVRAETNHSEHQMNTTEQKSKPIQWIVEASEFTFLPSRLEFKAGETINLILKNNGKVEHDFEIIGTNIHVHAAPGAEDSTSFTLDKPGTYRAVCTLPGHQEAGMVSIIKVG
jgi:uncharacterized cupredoxin-like copper-binding protein